MFDQDMLQSRAKPACRAMPNRHYLRWYRPMLAAAIATVSVLAYAQDDTTPRTTTTTAAIASANALATEAGFETLAQGGNAVDAAIAVATSLSVVQPEASGLGGGFLALIHDAATGKDTFIDAREMAPQAVSEADYLNADGTPNRDTSLNGPLAAGIPGMPAGLAYMAEKYGKLPLAVSLRPAIRLATRASIPVARWSARYAQGRSAAPLPGLDPQVLPRRQGPAGNRRLPRPGPGRDAESHGRTRRRRLLQGAGGEGNGQGGQGGRRHLDARRPGQLPGEGARADRTGLRRLQDRHRAAAVLRWRGGRRNAEHPRADRPQEHG